MLIDDKRPRRQFFTHFRAWLRGGIDPTPVEATPNKCLIAKVRFCLFLAAASHNLNNETRSVIFRTVCCFISELLSRPSESSASNLFSTPPAQSNYTRNPNCFRPSTRQSLMIRGNCVRISTTASEKTLLSLLSPLQVVDTIKI